MLLFAIVIKIDSYETYEHELSITPRRKKGVMLLIAFSYEAASERKPQIINKEYITPMRDAFLLYDNLRHSIPNALSQLFLLRYFHPISFRGFWLNAK